MCVSRVGVRVGGTVTPSSGPAPDESLQSVNHGTNKRSTVVFVPVVSRAPTLCSYNLLYSHHSSGLTTLNGFVGAYPFLPFILLFPLIIHLSQIKLNTNHPPNVHEYFEHSQRKNTVYSPQYRFIRRACPGSSTTIAPKKSKTNNTAGVKGYSTRPRTLHESSGNCLFSSQMIT